MGARCQGHSDTSTDPAAGLQDVRTQGAAWAPGLWWPLLGWGRCRGGSSPGKALVWTQAPYYLLPYVAREAASGVQVMITVIIFQRRLLQPHRWEDGLLWAQLAAA